MDPGLLKRNDDNKAYYEVPIKVVHKGTYKITRLCITCGIAKPFRSHHCTDCDNCTLNFDHHCPWLGNCIGKNNYMYFMIFLVCFNIIIMTNLFSCIIIIGLAFKNTSENGIKEKIVDVVKKEYYPLIMIFFSIIVSKKIFHIIFYNYFK